MDVTTWKKIRGIVEGMKTKCLPYIIQLFIFWAILWNSKRNASPPSPTLWRPCCRLCAQVMCAQKCWCYPNSIDTYIFLIWAKMWAKALMNIVCACLVVYWSYNMFSDMLEMSPVLVDNYTSLMWLNRDKIWALTLKNIVWNHAQRCPGCHQISIKPFLSMLISQLGLCQYVLVNARM